MKRALFLALSLACATLVCGVPSPADAQALSNSTGGGSDACTGKACSVSSLSSVGGATFGGTITSTYSPIAFEVGGGSVRWGGVGGGSIWADGPGAPNRLVTSSDLWVLGVHSVNGWLQNRGAGDSGSLVLRDAEGVLFYAAAGLPTCSATYEGRVFRDNTAGTSNVTASPTNARTRLCFCTSDGASSPSYAYQNVITGTVGTATACTP